MKELYKVNVKTGEERRYGKLSDEEIKEVVKGYKYDEELEIYYRKGSNWGFYTL